MCPQAKRLRLGEEDKPPSDDLNGGTSSTVPGSLTLRSSRLREREMVKRSVQPSPPPALELLIPHDSESPPFDVSPTPRPSPSLWKGWAELENDPAIFNVMLREWGVEGVKVEEVVPLDAIFDSSADSTHGLIFLSRYAPSDQKKPKATASANLWFANQTSSFSCATVALMNIVNNSTDINLGLELKQFKSSTANLSPKDRGLALDNFEHVRRVHNSFATEIDMMNVDLRLKQDASAAKKARAKKSKKKRKSNYVEDEEDENGFHFIAYVPVDDMVWKMDGMESRPVSLGKLLPDDTWLAMVIPDLQAQWETAMDNQLEFSLLSLVRGEKEVSDRAEDQDKADRLRDDWGPLIAALVRMHAAKGTLEENLG